MEFNTHDENLHTYDNGFKPKEVILKDNYKFYNKNIFFRLLSLIVKIITIIFLIPVKYILWGYRVKGKKNIKNLKEGAITISNHCLVQDPFCLVSSIFPRRQYVTTLQSNMGFFFVSRFLRICGAVPIPEDRKLFVKFLKETKKEIAENKSLVHIYPEAALLPYADKIRDFKVGAFHIAYDTKAPIIPICFTFHKNKGLYKLYKRKPSIHLNILEPYYPDFDLPKKECINKTLTDIHTILDNYFKENSDFYY